MFNKLYEKTKRFIIENYKILIVYLVLFAIILWPVPYYIYTGGGTLPVNSKITIDQETESAGSFNLAYVSEIKATVSTYLLSFLFPSWERVKVSDVTISDTETTEDVMIRDQIFLNDANQSAIKVAYEKAGKNFTIEKEVNRVIYLDPQAQTTLKIGDALLAVEGVTVTDTTELREFVKTKKKGDLLTLEIERDGEKMQGTATVQEINGELLLGISFLKEYIYKTDPNLTLHFSSNESGPSGGLIMALSIYDKLIPEDLTHGLKIVGTGTIDSDGKVGEIGGVRYKLKGAVSQNADIFLVPNGANYEECMELKEKNNYDIKIIGVSTFDEAVQALEELS